MAITNFIPKVWSAELLVALEKSLVYGQLVNRNYEGEISQAGDTVNITSLANPTVGTYTAHTDITVEDVDDTTAQLVINQSKYFAFEVDDIEKRQALGNVLPEQTRKAGYLLADTVDQYLAGLMKAAATNTGGTGVTLATAGAVYDSLVDIGVQMDINNVPTQGRWAVLPPIAYPNILKDSRFVGAGAAQQQLLRDDPVLDDAGR